MTAGPIFVAGLERSGTSLAYAMLASHPRIAMTRRTNLWTHFYNQYGDLADLDNFERCVAMMMRYKRIVKLQPDADRLRRDFLAGDRTYARLFSLVEEHYAERVGKPRWGDKSLNTENFAEPILNAYEGARILHMIRDPRDRFASSVTRWEKRRGGVGAGTAEWLASVHRAEEFQARFPASYMIVRYEDLVTDPEETVSTICGFIGEDYDPAMLTMGGAPSLTEKGFNSSYGPVEGIQISTASIGRFRSILPPSQVAFVQLVANEEMARHGYPSEPTELDGIAKYAYRTGRVPLELARMAAWRTRELVRDRRGRPVPEYRIVDSAPKS
ncbi:MAG: sulfotransferase [Acidimicrobiia bacterium]|nr:sulfotransferase [Acidimicrobiia bacterium]